MRIDIDHMTLPEPEAVLLLKDEVRRLESVIAASQPTLTDEERALLSRLGSDTREWDKFSNGRPWFVRVEDAAIIRGILERLG